jgi:Holliday junction resolvasome RuvABC endonuclease subunit
MKILALDLSTKGTGWAETGGLSGVQGFASRRGESPGMRWLRFRAWLLDMVNLLDPDVIAYEQAHHRGGAATHCAHAMIGIVEQTAAEHDIELTNRSTSAIKKHATGKGKASKEEMLQAARENWWDKSIETDDEADALWLLDLVQEELGDETDKV